MAFGIRGWPFGLAINCSYLAKISLGAAGLFWFSMFLVPGFIEALGRRRLSDFSAFAFSTNASYKTFNKPKALFSPVSATISVAKSPHSANKNP